MVDIVSDHRGSVLLFSDGVVSSDARLHRGAVLPARGLVFVTWGARSRADCVALQATTDKGPDQVLDPQVVTPPQYTPRLKSAEGRKFLPYRTCTTSTIVLQGSSFLICECGVIDGTHPHVSTKPNFTACPNTGQMATGWGIE